MSDRVHFFAAQESGKRSFTLRPTALTAKSVALMSTITDFELRDAESGARVALEQCQAGRTYEVRRAAQDAAELAQFVRVASLAELERAPRQVGGRRRLAAFECSACVLG